MQFCVSLSCVTIINMYLNSSLTTRKGSGYIIFYIRNQGVIFQKFLKHQKSNRFSLISEGLTYAKIRLQKHELHISLNQLSVMWNDKWEWNGLSVWSFNTFPPRRLTHILARGSLLSFYKRPTSTQEVASADICENNYSSTALIYRFCRHFSVLYEPAFPIYLRCFAVKKKKKAISWKS